MNRHHLCDLHKGLIIIDSMSLCVTFTHESSFEPSNRTVTIVLDIVNPPASDQFGMFGWVNQVLGVIYG